MTEANNKQPRPDSGRELVLQPAPYRPCFQNNVLPGQLYCMVHVNGNTIEIKSFGLDGELLDYVPLEKGI